MKKYISLILIFTFTLSACTKKDESSQSTVVSFLDANISHLDPIHSMNKYSSTINGSIFEGLYHYHYLKRPLTVEPSLAVDLPKISSDGRTYIIKIKPGIYFQDDPAFPEGKGRELVASDFFYSWKRLADPTNKALGWWVLDGLVEGLNEWRDQFRKGQVNYDTPVSGLQSPDKYTLKIKLTRKSYQFLNFLAMPVTMVMAKEVVNHYGKEIINHPVGTGPYKLQKWVRNSEVQLIKNKNYRKSFYPISGAPNSKAKRHLKHAGKNLPLSDKVIVKIMTEKQPIWLAFLKGEIDHGSIPKDNYDQVIKDNQFTGDYSGKGMKIYLQPRPDVTFIAFNMEHPILGKNKNLRKAFAASLDKKLILKVFYNNRGIVAQSPIPPNMDAYDPDYKHPVQFDMKKAKEYLKLAGYPEGKGLPLIQYELPSTSTWSRQFGELFKDQWGRIGIKLKLKANTWPQFDKKIKSKKASMFDMGWFADYPDAENFFQMFYSKNVSPGSNNFNFMNRNFDKIYEMALALPSGPERNKLFRKLVDIVNEEVPGIFMAHRIFRLPYHGWLENYNEYPVIYDHLQYLHVDQKKKKELLKKL